MDAPFRYLRLRLRQADLLPSSRLALVACYLLGLEILLFARKCRVFKVPYGQVLSGWLIFLSATVAALLLVLAYRRLKVSLLWRLRNRLIVTYVFFGLISVFLLVTIGFITLYLFAGQFANFVVTSDLHSRLRRLEAVNAAIGEQLSTKAGRGEAFELPRASGLPDEWFPRQICAWKDGRALPLCGSGAKPLPGFLKPPFSAIVRDHDQVFLRSAASFQAGSTWTVMSSKPLNRDLLDRMAADLGEIRYIRGNRSRNRQFESVHRYRRRSAPNDWAS